jgi:hypothetical protein
VSMLSELHITDIIQYMFQRARRAGQTCSKVSQPLVRSSPDTADPTNSCAQITFAAV